MTTRTLFAFVALVCTVCRLGAVEEAGLEMTVVFSKTERQGDIIRDNFASGEGHQRYDFEVVLRNAGNEPLIVPKGLSDSSYGINHGALDLLYGWNIFSTETGEPNIPSESELGLVKLQKGEATQFHVAIRTDQKVDEKSIKFAYMVGEKIAARFGTWSGRLETVALNWSDLQLLKQKRQQDQKEQP